MLEDGYSSWSFDAFELERASCGHPLSAMGYFLLARTGLMSTWSIKPRKAALFFRVLEDGYRCVFQFPMFCAELRLALVEVCSAG